MKDIIEPVFGEDNVISISRIEAFACKESYQRIVKLLDDALLITLERDYPALQLIVNDIRGHIEKVGKLSGLNGQKRLELKGGAE